MFYPLVLWLSPGIKSIRKTQKERRPLVSLGNFKQMLSLLCLLWWELRGGAGNLKKGQTHRDSLSLIPDDICRLRPLRSVLVFTGVFRVQTLSWSRLTWWCGSEPTGLSQGGYKSFPLCRVHLIPWLASSKFWFLPVWSRVKSIFLIGLEGRSVRCACTGLAQLVPCGCWCAFVFPWSLPLSPGVTH